jgi:hypothetical protein
MSAAATPIAARAAISSPVPRASAALAEVSLIRGFDRLRAAIEAADEPDMLQRLRGSGLRYRNFALSNRPFYAIMFEGPILPGHESAEVAEHAMAAFGALVRNVETAAAAGSIAAGDPGRSLSKSGARSTGRWRWN